MLGVLFGGVCMVAFRSYKGLRRFSSTDIGACLWLHVSNAPIGRSRPGIMPSKVLQALARSQWNKNTPSYRGSTSPPPSSSSPRAAVRGGHVPAGGGDDQVLLQDAQAQHRGAGEASTH
jgi:hypothetical protein